MQEKKWLTNIRLRVAENFAENFCKTRLNKHNVIYNAGNQKKWCLSILSCVTTCNRYNTSLVTVIGSARRNNNFPIRCIAFTASRRYGAGIIRQRNCGETVRLWINCEPKNYGTIFYFSLSLSFSIILRWWKVQKERGRKRKKSRETRTLISFSLKGQMTIIESPERTVLMLKDRDRRQLLILRFLRGTNFVMRAGEAAKWEWKGRRDAAAWNSALSSGPSAFFPRNRATIFQW